jgi:hypothetical protein
MRFQHLFHISNMKRYGIYGETLNSTTKYETFLKIVGGTYYIYVIYFFRHDNRLTKKRIILRKYLQLNSRILLNILTNKRIFDSTIFSINSNNLAKLIAIKKLILFMSQNMNLISTIANLYNPLITLQINKK